VIGKTLAHYQIVEKIGAGGMGEVYRALDTKLGREVALKILPPETASRPGWLDRFRREARALAALDHPGIVTVHSVEEADGVHFLTMQLVEGRPLDEIIPQEGLPADRIVEIGIALSEALAAAHARDIVHRDLKPANVMVTHDERIKVLDFGLAKSTEPSPDEATVAGTNTEFHTRAGAVMGTVPYMSPEQVAGRTVDHRSDIFSLGVMLYEMASGRRPFQGESSAEVASAILRDSPPPLADRRAGLPHGLLEVVTRCLEKEPGARFEGMRDVAAALREVEPAPGAPRSRPASSARRVAGGGAALLLVAAVAALMARSGFLGSPGAGGPEIRSIAVLPLDNYSGDPSQDYFAEGITDAITADLARISRIRVISRGSAMQFGGANRPSTPEIAKTLDVDAIVEGSVQRSGDRVRITAQLIDARADRHLWAENFERSSEDVLALQSDLASAIAREIHVQLAPAEPDRAGGSRRVNPEAYDAYLKGRYFFGRPSDENLQKAIARFEDALALDPGFVPALSGLSDAYLWAGYNEGFMTASEARPKARAAAEKAIRLDGRSAEAHTSLAVFKAFYEYDWKGAEAEYRRAIELNPSYAYAHDQFAIGLAFQGRFEESIAEGRIAAELDPLNPQIPIDAAFAPTWQGDSGAARELVARAVELDPTYFLSVFLYAWIDIQDGRLADAIPNLQKSKSMGAPAFVSAWLAYAYGASGDPDRARAEVEDLTRISLEGRVTPFNSALVALGLGEHTRAVSLLEQAHAMDSQWLGWLGYDRVFDPLRSDPRFGALLKRLGFAD